MFSKWGKSPLAKFKSALSGYSSANTTSSMYQNEFIIISSFKANLIERMGDPGLLCMLFSCAGPFQAFFAEGRRALGA